MFSRHHIRFCVVNSLYTVDPMERRSEEQHLQPKKPTVSDDADAKFPIGQVTTLGERDCTK